VLPNNNDAVRKILGMIQSSEGMLRITVQNDILLFRYNGSTVGMLTTAEFEKMSANEILHFLGVENDS
jgi:hypothetical protein